MHQNLAVILRQFSYVKNSFIVLVPDSVGTDFPCLSRGHLVTAAIGWTGQRNIHSRGKDHFTYGWLQLNWIGFD